MTQVPRPTGRGEVPVLLTTSDFYYVRDLVREKSGLVLEDGKAYLAETRLAQLARGTGMASAQEVVDRLRTGRDDALSQKVVEALATNETSFFRDIHPFDALRKVVLPDVVRRREADRKLNIWCGACSTGQEPYSIAMLIREHFPNLLSWDLRILATDLATDVLAKAKKGLFTQLEVNRGLPAPLLVKYFERRGVEWQIRDDVGRMITFAPLNLLTGKPDLPAIDVVFLRNVLIYFDVPTKKSVLGRIRRWLRPEGYLFLGGAETTWNLDDGYDRVPYEKTTVYRPRA